MVYLRIYFRQFSQFFIVFLFTLLGIQTVLAQGATNSTGQPVGGEVTPSNGLIDVDHTKERVIVSGRQLSDDFPTVSAYYRDDQTSGYELGIGVLGSNQTFGGITGESYIEFYQQNFNIIQGSNPIMTFSLDSLNTQIYNELELREGVGGLVLLDLGHRSNGEYLGAQGYDFTLGFPGREGVILENNDQEGAGFFANSDLATIWSPGDQNRLLRVLDEDGMIERWYLDEVGAAFQVSDENVKENIETLTDVADRIRQLRGVTFQYKLNEEEVAKGQEAHDQIGFIAQEVEAVFPELVQTSPTGQKALNYTGLIPIILQAYNNRTLEVENMRAELNTLKEELSAIRTALQSNAPDLLEVEERSERIIRPSDATLQQNAPNPFTEATTITYFVPEGITEATVQIMNQSGRVLSVIPIDETGEGQITLQADLLSAGTYSYVLILDGQIVVSKQMVLTK
jgi:hypothetical protein